jgi:hypothetical protein
MIEGSTNFYFPKVLKNCRWKCGIIINDEMILFERIWNEMPENGNEPTVLGKEWG